MYLVVLKQFQLQFYSKFIPNYLFYPTRQLGALSKRYIPEFASINIGNSHNMSAWWTSASSRFVKFVWRNFHQTNYMSMIRMILSYHFLGSSMCSMKLLKKTKLGGNLIEFLKHKQYIYLIIRKAKSFASEPEFTKNTTLNSLGNVAVNL